jgi:hypothetical protein
MSTMAIDCGFPFLSHDDGVQYVNAMVEFHYRLESFPGAVGCSSYLIFCDVFVVVRPQGGNGESVKQSQERESRLEWETQRYCLPQWDLWYLLLICGAQPG